MILLLFFLLYALVVITLLYALLFGSCSFNKRGYIRALSIFIFERIPQYAVNFYRKFFPRNNEIVETENDKASRSKKYSLLVLIAYYVVYHFFAAVFLVNVYPKIPQFMRNGDFWQLAVYGVLPGPWLVFIILQLVDPGIITEENVNYYIEKYPYDNVIYKPKKCRHLGIPAVARSRYCPVTKQRVAKYDHYSMWVIQVIGEKTLRLYILFVVMNTAVTLFFFVLTVLFIRYVLVSEAEEVVWTESNADNFVIAITIVLRDAPVAAGLAIALCIIGADLLATLVKQFNRVSQNVTEVECELYEKGAEKGEIVKNIYDRGFIANWVEVLFPKDE